MASKPKRHPGGPRGGVSIGVKPYLTYLRPEQLERIKALQHEKKIDSRAEMIRILIEKGLEAADE